MKIIFFLKFDINEKHLTLFSFSFIYVIVQYKISL